MKTSCSMAAGKESGNSKQELELSLPVSFHCHPWLNRALKLSSSNVFDIKCPPESPFSNCFMWAYGSEGDTDMESWLCQGPYFSKSNSSLLELFTPHQISPKLWTAGSPGKCRKKAECIQGFNTSRGVSHVSRLHLYRCHLGARHPHRILWWPCAYILEDF